MIAMTRISFAIAVLLLLTRAAEAQDHAAPISLTVADAVARGLEASHRIAEIRAREEGARAAIKIAELARMPTVSATAGFTRTSHVAEFAVPQTNGSRLVVFPDLPNNFSTRLGFQWPIFTAGRTDALERAAAAEASAVAAEIETARLDLRFEIVRAYWASVTARESARVLRESTARADAQLNDARQRFKVGLIPPNEVLSLEAQASRERAQLAEAQNLFESALVDLRRLTGIASSTEVDLVDPLEPGVDKGEQFNLPGLIAEAEGRPERQVILLRREAIEARQQAAASATRPSINFVGGIDYANPNARVFPRRDAWERFWDLGVQVNWNVFDFGRARAQVAELEAGVSASRARLAEFDSVVAADLEQRMLEQSSIHAMVEAARDAVRSATEARRVVADRFAVGVASSTDVVVAQVAQLEAELQLMRSLASMRLAHARLDRARGRP